MNAAPDCRLRLYANPLRLLFSASLWRSAAFLLSYLLVGVVLFGVAVTVSITSAALAFTIVAVPLVIAAAWTVHGCAWVQRGLLRLAFAQPVTARYERPGKPGLIASAKAAWQSGATWREVGYLAGLFAPLFTLDVIVFSLWASFAAAISLPFWYSKPYNEVHGHRLYGVQLGYFPGGPHAANGFGLFVDSLPKAWLAAAIFIILFLLFSYVLVITARVHARIARAVLRQPADPLAEAKTVLSASGPLGPLTPTSG